MPNVRWALALALAAGCARHTTSLNLTGGTWYHPRPVRDFAIDLDYRVTDPKADFFTHGGGSLTAAQLERGGQHHVVSPVFNHLLLQYSDLPGDWSYWRSYSLTLLRRCDHL